MKNFVILTLLLSGLVAGCDWFDGGNDDEESSGVETQDQVVSAPDIDRAPAPADLEIPEGGYVVSYEYDDSGRLVKASYSDRGEISYQFDSAGNMVNVEESAQ